MCQWLKMGAANCCPTPVGRKNSSPTSQGLATVQQTVDWGSQNGYLFNMVLFQMVRVSKKKHFQNGTCFQMVLFQMVSFHIAIWWERTTLVFPKWSFFRSLTSCIQMDSRFKSLTLNLWNHLGTKSQWPRTDHLKKDHLRNPKMVLLLNKILFWRRKNGKGPCENDPFWKCVLF